jgi:hypothetical protein
MKYVNHLQDTLKLAGLAMLGVLWLGIGTTFGQSAFNCGTFDYSTTGDPYVENSMVEPRLELFATVTGSPTNPPANVRFDWDIYKDGAFFGSVTTTASFIIVLGTTGFAVGNNGIPITECGEYYAEVTAVGLTGGPPPLECFTVTTFTTDEICVSQVNDGLNTLTCDPEGVCPGSTGSRLAQSTGLALEATPQANGSALLLRAHSPEATQATFQLLDLRGQVLMERRLDLAQGWTPHKLSTASLSAGIYLLRLHTSREQVSQKVILR